jgi:hypothetical protein
MRNSCIQTHPNQYKFLDRFAGLLFQTFHILNWMTRRFPLFWYDCLSKTMHESGVKFSPLSIIHVAFFDYEILRVFFFKHFIF